MGIVEMSGIGSVSLSARDDKSHRVKLPKGTSRRVLTFASPYRGVMSQLLLLIAADALLGNVNPLIYRAILDDGIVKHHPTLVMSLALLAASLGALGCGVGLLERWASARIGYGVIFDLRNRAFQHLQRMPLAFFTNIQTGALMARLSTDVQGARQAFTDTLNSVVGNALSVSLTLLIMVLLSWKLTLLSLVLLPLFILPSNWLAHRLASLIRQGYALDAETSSMMSERFNIAGALLVQIFGRPERESSEFRRRAGKVRDIGVKSAMYDGFFLYALLLTISVATALVYGVGGVSAADGSLSVGTLVALTLYLARLYAPVMALSRMPVDVMTALISFDRIFEILDFPSIIVDHANAKPLVRKPARIEFDHVGFRYPPIEQVSLVSLQADVRPQEQDGSGRSVLRDVSFVVEPGQLVALVGHSGAGKTTISHLVARLYDATEGSVRINGRDVRDATLASLRDMVGVVTQDAHLFHDSIRANLLFADPAATETRLLEVLRQAQVLEVIASLPQGLDTVVGDKGYRLSGGEKQRIAIARLLLKEPEIVVLDEATAHLDSESELAVQKALSEVLSGRTSIVIAHRLSTVREAHLILVVEDGRIVERGEHLELLNAGGPYSELYRTQFVGQVL